jgi:hypothetical protein
MYFNGNIGSITDCIKNALFEQKLQQKKIEFSMAKLKSGKLREIEDKMKSGRRLSYDEKEFLRIHVLDFEKAMRIENERDEFRYALANCKTKEEAKRLKTSKSLEMQREARTMSDSKFIVMKMMAIFEEYADFIKSEEYAYIPSEYEENDDNRYKLNETKALDKQNFFEMARSLRPDLIPNF